MSVYQGRAYGSMVNQTALSNAVRKTWVDYVSWTTALTYAILFGTADKEIIEDRLKRNAGDYATIFEQYYGVEAGDRMRAIFLQVQEAMTDLIEAHMERDLTKITNSRQQIYALGDEIGKQMAQLNPNWDRTQIQIGMYELTNAFEDQIVHIMAQDYDESVDAYDDLLNQAYRISDDLTYGLIRQFQLSR